MIEAEKGRCPANGDAVEYHGHLSDEMIYGAVHQRGAGSKDKIRPLGDILMGSGILHSYARFHRADVIGIPIADPYLNVVG